MNVITERYSLYEGDCLELMKTFPDNHFSTVLTDPPYGLGKQPDTVKLLQHWMNGEEYKSSNGFMNKDWDVLPGPAVWKEVYRVLKPGGFCLVFAGTRTFDLMTLALRLAGFEIRDCCMWLHGQGMPKGANISKHIDAHLGARREVVGESLNTRPNSDRGNGLAHGEYGRVWNVDAPATDAAKLWDGWHTGLSPAWEPIIVAMKPLDGTFAQNALKWNVAGLNVDGTRIPTDEKITFTRPANNVSASGWKETNRTTEYTQPAGGRWPANLILDQSAADLLDEMSGELTSGKLEPHHNRNEQRQVYGKYNGKEWDRSFGGDTGGASRYFTVLPDSEIRFFYSSKASRAEREQGLEDLPEHDKANQYGDGLNSATKIRTDEQSANGVDRGTARNFHPTVKNLSLMRWLVRLTKTPTGGNVLDPFAGSGTTGVACLLEGRKAVLIEREPEYYTIAHHRLEHWQEEADTAPRKLRGKVNDLADMPLFADIVDIGE